MCPATSPDVFEETWMTNVLGRRGRISDSIESLVREASDRGLAGDPFHLEGVEPAINAVAGDQLVVPPDLGDAALVDDHDAVGVAHRRQAMCDHQHGAPLHEIAQGLLHDELAL